MKANFYLAQLYFSDAQESKSIPNYEYVIEQPRSEFTEQSLARLAQIFLKNEEFSKAIPVLIRLENEDTIKANNA